MKDALLLVLLGLMVASALAAVVGHLLRLFEWVTS
ncbi:exported hypothetical protein [Agrobacterium genomosp. 5 str. CFBP 6626]|nr:exported hypothetical protein [Agrobacterium genomosp. 5 str. CFBP 6626]